MKASFKKAKRNSFSFILVVCAILLATGSTRAQQIRNVVLVHGAFADGSGWRALWEILTKRGYQVSVVQNPLTSLEDDVAATHVELERLDGPAVLVGHSWGGAVIT